MSFKVGDKVYRVDGGKSSMNNIDEPPEPTVRLCSRCNGLLTVLQSTDMRCPVCNDVEFSVIRESIYEEMVRQGTRWPVSVQGVLF